MSTQNDWRWCNKCNVLAYAGLPSVGACAASGVHDHGGSSDYRLLVGAAYGQGGQTNWRWCNKCNVLSFAGAANQGVCPTGGVHDHGGSGDYALSVDPVNDGGMTTQVGWRWCNRCQALAFSQNTTPGACAAGGQHDFAGSGLYRLGYQSQLAVPNPPVVIDVLSSSHPAQIPAGMTATFVVGPDSGAPSPTGPVLYFNGHTYWAYSFSDNRVAMGIVEYDAAGALVRQWEKAGARYLWKISVDVSAQTVTFRGQSNQTVVMSWAEIIPAPASALVPPPAVVMAPSSSAPSSIPSGMRVGFVVGPDSGAPRATGPVLSWNGYTYWAYSYLDNRMAMGIVAYDPAGAIVQTWEKPGARYLWKITLDAVQKTVTFWGQSSQTIVVAWSELLGLPIPPAAQAYFWLCNTATSSALECAPDTAGDPLAISSVPVRAMPHALSDSQLWRRDEASGVVINRATGRALSIEQGALVAVHRAIATAPRWAFAEGLFNQDTGQALDVTQSTVTPVPLPSPWPANPPVPLPTSQTWSGMSYVPAPDISTDELRARVAQTFHIVSLAVQPGSNGQALMRQGATGVAIGACNMDQPTASPDEMIWTCVGGQLLNYLNQVESALIAAPSSSGAYALSCVATSTLDAQSLLASQWQLTTDGLLVHSSSKLVLGAPSGGQGLRLAVYDPMQPAEQVWMLQMLDCQMAPSSPPVVQASVMEPQMVGPAVMAPAPHVLRPSLTVNKLIVTVTIGSGWLDGTSKKVSIAFDGTIHQEANRGWDPVHGVIHEWYSGKTYTLDMSSLFSGRPFSDLQTMSIDIDQGSWYTFNDNVRIDSVSLTVNDVYTVNRKVDTEIRSYLAIYFPQHEWVMVDPSAPSTPGVPFDWSGKTYSIGLKPWIGDLLSWRSYDPSTIDGVGVLLGQRNGKLVGMQIKQAMCEELRANGPNDSYTWVYTPGGAILYKFWNHREPKANYTRHSQLAAGTNVICAGEFRLQSTFTPRSTRGSALEDFIAMVNDASGHFKPEGQNCLYYVSQQLDAMGVDTSSAEWRWTITG